MSYYEINTSDPNFRTEDNLLFFGGRLERNMENPSRYMVRMPSF
jgi:hypothetical protein